MKIESRNTIIIISLIGVVFGVSAVLFFIFGLTTSLYFALIGIPLAFAVGIALYIAKTKSSGGRPEAVAQKIKVKELEKVMKRFLGLSDRVSDIEMTFNVDADRTKLELNDVKTRFHGLGCMRNEKGELLKGKYNIELVGKVVLPEISKLSDDIGKIELRFGDLLHKAIIEKSEWFIKKLELLKSYGFNVESQISQLHVVSKKGVSNDLNSQTGLMKEISEYFDDALNVSLSEALKLVNAATQFGENVSDVQSDLDLASENKARKDYDNVIFLLQKSMDNLKTTLQTVFAEQKEVLLKAIDEILKNIDESVSERAQIEEIREKVIRETSPLKLPLLMKANENLLNVSRVVVETVYEEIRKRGEEIAAFNPPEYFWNPEMIPEDTFQQLCSERDINRFALLFGSVYKSFKSRADYDSLKVRILKSFSGKIEQRIRKKVEERGQLSASELGVAQPEEFLKLYASFHSETEYDEATKILSLSSGEITPLPSQPPSPAGALNLSLTISDFDIGAPLDNVSVTVEKGLKRFEQIAMGGSLLLNLERGKYHLKTSLSGYKMQELDVSLTTNEEMEIKLKKMGLKELLCKDKEEAILKYVVKYSSIVEKEMEKSGFVTSDFDLKINRDFNPCFLYVWSEDKPNAGFLEIRDGYMVYDREKVKTRLLGAINELNPDLDERYGLSELKELLHIPLPETELSKLVDEMNNDKKFLYEVEVNDRHILIRRK